MLLSQIQTKEEDCSVSMKMLLVPHSFGYCKLAEGEFILPIYLSIKILTSYPESLPSAISHDLRPQGVGIEHRGL